MSKIPLDDRAKLNQDLYRRWRDARSGWDTDARTDIDFHAGNHYTEDEDKDLQSVNQAAVPMDRTGPAVEKLKSIITSRTPAFTIIQREDSDSKMANVWRTIIGYVWDISDGDMQMKQSIHDYAVTGLGWLYVYVDSESDFNRGDVKFTSVNPFRVFVPPSSRDRYFDDADGIIISTILTREQVIRLYPELGDRTDPLSGETIEGIIDDLSVCSDEDYPSAQSKQSINTYQVDEVRYLDSGNISYYQILERFYKTKVPFYILMDTRDGSEQVLSESEFQSFVAENRNDLERGLIEFEEVMQTRVGVSATLSEISLYEDILNTDKYPIIPLPNLYTGTPYPRSDISRARPMQRLLNKLWSLAVSHAQASAGLKLLVPLGSVDDIDQLERDWANPTAVIEIDTSQGEPHTPSPTPLAAEFYRLIDSAEFYIDFTFGLPELMHGFSEKAPETVRGTERMLAQGAERPKSKLRDIEFAISRLGKVIYGLSKNHYTYKKMFRLVQANNNINEVTVNLQLYDDKSQAVYDIAKDRYNIGQHDITVQPGSTLPSNKWTEYQVYLEAYREQLVDRTEVLKKNPEIFDVEGVITRMSEIAQLQKLVEQLQGQVKNLQGDLQTAQRESVSDRKRVEVEKFKTKLGDVQADAKVKSNKQVSKLESTVKLESEKLKGVVNDIISNGSAQDDFGTL